MKQIKNYKNINQKRAVVEYITGEKELIETKKNQKLSHTYDYIGEFKYNEDLNTEVALVKIELGKNLRKKDTLIGYINIDGILISDIYSIYLDELYHIKNEKLDELINMIYNKLYYDSQKEEKKEEQAITKLRLLFRIYKEQNSKKNNNKINQI